MPKIVDKQEKREKILEAAISVFAKKGMTKAKMAAFSLKKIYEESRQMIKDILDECAASEKIQPIDTRIASSIIIGTMDGLMVQWITDPDAFSIEESFETTAKIILNGLKKQ